MVHSFGGMSGQTSLTVGFSWTNVGEQQQSCILAYCTEEREGIQELLHYLPGKAPSVKVEVNRCYQETRGRVQADAEAPDVALRGEANGGANRREIVVDLHKELNLSEKTGFGSSVTAGSYNELQQIS